MGKDRYRCSKQLHYEEICPDRVGIRIELVAILKGRRENRELKLIPEKTRVVCKNEIHEFNVTDEPDSLPGNTINRDSHASASRPGSVS